MAAMIEPLTPPDLDLRDFTYMPLEVVRLRDSDLVVLASGDEFRAAVMLWCAAWHQVPAASLPNDERILANLAGYGRDLRGWRSVRAAAMRGFVECSDGRLYHSVIAEKAIESGSKKRIHRSQTAAATEARRQAKEKRDAERNEQRNEQRNDKRDVQRNDNRNDADEMQRHVHQGNGRDRKGEEKKKEGAIAPPEPNLLATSQAKPQLPDPERDYFRRVREVVGQKEGGPIGAKLLKAKGGKISMARAAIEQASEKEKPVEYVFAIINGADKEASQRGMDPRL